MGWAASQAQIQLQALSRTSGEVLRSPGGSGGSVDQRMMFDLLQWKTPGGGLVNVAYLDHLLCHLVLVGVAVLSVR